MPRGDSVSRTHRDKAACIFILRPDCVRLYCGIERFGKLLMYCHYQALTVTARVGTGNFSKK